MTTTTATITAKHAAVQTIVGVETRASNVMAVLHGANDLRIQSDAPVAALQPGEVTVHVHATGLCGSDAHYYCHGRNGDFALQHPMCLGHESVGEVVAMSVEAQKQHPSLHVGSRVAIEPGLNCETCTYCLSGRYNLCSNMRFASSAKSTPHLHGTLQRFVNWPARLCHALPEHVDWQTAALAEPLAVVLQALQRARFQANQRVLVVGAGAVGLLACAAVKHFGAQCTAAVDVAQTRLDMAQQLSWSDASYLNPAGSQDDEKTQAALMKSTLAASLSDDTIQSEGFDVVFECTGVPACVRTSIHAAKPGGVVCLIGMGHPNMSLPIGAAALREVDIVGVFRYANMFPKAIDLLANSTTMAAKQTATQQSTARAIISHAFPLTQADHAFATLKAGASPDGQRVVKIMVVDD